MSEQVLEVLAEAQRDVGLFVQRLRDQQKLQFAMFEDMVERMSEVQKSLWLLDHELRRDR